MSARFSGLFRKSPAKAPRVSSTSSTDNNWKVWKCRRCNDRDQTAIVADAEPRYPWFQWPLCLKCDRYRARVDKGGPCDYSRGGAGPITREGTYCGLCSGLVEDEKEEMRLPTRCDCNAYRVVHSRCVPPCRECQTRKFNVKVDKGDVCQYTE